MIQSRYRPSLPLETFTELLFRDLDRNGAVEPRITGFVHLTHPARADRRDDFIGPEALSRRDSHGAPLYRSYRPPTPCVRTTTASQRSSISV
jgi:hypothetical protein